TACGRVLQSRSTIVIEDVMADPDFAPYREVAHRAGFRAVQSTPLVSHSGAFVGVVSSHFSTVQRPTELQLRWLKEAAESAADAIIRIWANGREGQLQKSLASLEQSFRAIADAEKLLSGGRRATTRRGRAAAK